MNGSGDTNYGIYQSGSGHIQSSGPTAVGSHAAASSGSSQEGTLTAPQALAQLRQLLAERGGELPDAARAQARGEIEEISEQLESPTRDRGRLSAALSRLSTALASVTTLAIAAEALRTAAESLFS